MKIAQTIAGILLGLLFVFSASMVLFKLVSMPELPPDTPIYHFMAAFGPTGYMTFVKVCELLGGILVAIPKTRNFGLLVLGPIIVNILAFHLFVAGGGFLDPILLAVIFLAAFLLVTERKAFFNLLH